jgi:hypothetical protein
LPETTLCQIRVLWRKFVAVFAMRYFLVFTAPLFSHVGLILGWCAEEQMVRIAASAGVAPVTYVDPAI